MAKIKTSLFGSIIKPHLLALLLIMGIQSPYVVANSLEKTVQETQTEKQAKTVETAGKQTQESSVENESADTLDSSKDVDTLNAADKDNATLNNPAEDNPSKNDPPKDALSLDAPSKAGLSKDKTAAEEDSITSQQHTDKPNSNESYSQVAGTLASASIIDLDQWRFLHQYTASYDIISDGDRLGRASRTLKKDEDGWKLEISTKLKKWLLTLRSNEFSRFRIVNNQLKTDEFYTSTKVSFKDPRIIRQHFDWENQLEQGSKNKRKWELPLDELLYDRMSHFVKLRADLLSDSKDFKYTVSYKGSRKSYEYVASGNEVLKTPMGNIETIRFDRVSGDDSSFSIWLSPDYNFFPIKIAQIEQDKPDVTLALTKLEFMQASTTTK